MRLNVMGKNCLPALILTILACLSQKTYAQNLSAVTITDLRGAEQLTRRRDSAFSAIALLSEKSIRPAPVVQLQAALENHNVTGKALKLTITELRVIDFFPSRLRSSAGGGMLMDLFVDTKTDWSFVRNMKLPEDEDSIVCILVGTLNGNEVKVFAFSPYRASIFAVSIHADKHFKAAVAEAINEVAEKALANVDQ